MRLKIGSNRIVLVGKRYVYKLPLGSRGIKANRVEYQNARGKDYVALTERKWYGLKQERLTDLITLPHDYTGEISPEWAHLLNVRVYNRFQVGKDKNGKWKFFDYEDVKYKGQGEEYWTLRVTSQEKGRECRCQYTM